MQSLLKLIARWLSIILVFLVPVFFLPTTQEFYITNKFYLLTYGVLTLLAISTVHLLITRKIVYTKRPFDKILFLAIAASAVSVIFSSPNKFQALLALPTGLAPLLALVLFYFVMTGRSSRSDKPVPVMMLLVLSTALAGLISIIFFFQPLVNAQLPSTLAFLQNPRFSPVGNQIDTLYILGFVGIYGLVSLFQRFKGKTKKLSPQVTLATILSIAASGLILFGLFKPGGDAPQVQLPPYSVSWFAAIDSLKTVQTALVGVGVDNYESLFTLVKPAAYNQTELWQLNFSLSRSAILHTWVETGLLGLLAVLLLGVYVIRELNGLFQAGDKNATQLSALGAYLGLIMLLMPPSFIVSFLFFSYLIVLTNRVQKHDHDEPQVIDLRKLVPVYVSIALVSLGVLGGLFYLTSRAYTAEYYFKSSLDSIRENNGQEVYNNQLLAIQTNPYIERYHAQFSQINLLLANNLAQQEELSDQDRQTIAQFIQQSISEAKRLVQLNPQKAANWNNLAVIYRNIINVAQGADAWTVASYRRAILQDPSNPLLRLNLGGVFYAAQNFGEATRSFEQAVSLKPDWANAHYNLAWAQFQSGQFDRAVVTMQNVLRLVEADSDDFTRAQENIEAFKQQIEDAEASGSGTLQQGDELSIPTPDSPQISPPIELPEGTGPEEEIESQPTPEPRNEQQEVDQEDLENTDSEATGEGDIVSPTQEPIQ